MNNDTSTSTAERSAQQALGEAAKAENLKAIAALADTADRQQQADHIRGIVAATMAHLALDATAATRASAHQWQAWALGLSEGMGGTPELAG